MAYQKAITADGYKLLADKSNPVVADAFVISQTKLSDVNSANLDSLTQALTFHVTRVMYDGGYYCPMATLNNNEVDNNFVVNTIGLVGHQINSDQSVLLAVVSDDDPITIPSDDEGIYTKPIMFRLTNYITSSINNSSPSSSDTSNIDLSDYVKKDQLTITLGGYVTDTALDSAVANIHVPAASNDSAYFNQNDYDKALLSNKISSASLATETMFNQLTADNSAIANNVALNSTVAQSYFNQFSSDLDSLKSYVDSKFGK